MKAKSAVRLFRKHILGPGKTSHSGRGFWMMYTSCSIPELRRRTIDWVERNPDKVDTFIPSDERGVMVLRLVEGYGDMVDWGAYGLQSSSPVQWNYRTLCIPPKNVGRFFYVSVAM
jgi:hypothetical protein